MYQFENADDNQHPISKHNSFSSEGTVSLSNFKLSFLDRKVNILLCLTIFTLVAFIAVSIYAVYVSLFLHGYILISKEATVETYCGTIQGFSSNDVVSFLGIPYALPPVSTNRFNKPVELSTKILCSQAWNISQLAKRPIYKAHKYRDICKQFVPITNEVIGNEDCLYLNVFSPRIHKPEELHPVIFLIGGFFFNYGGAANDSSLLHQPNPETVINLNAIHVTFNYRLGPFGFLTHPSTNVANIAIRDQLAALRWVRNNIRAFGGDPLKITIFSYGSGSTTALALLGSPLAQNLFDKAWISAPALRKPEITLDSAVAASKDLFKCEEHDCKQSSSDVLRFWNWTVVEPFIEQFFTLPSKSNTYCLPGLPCNNGILVIDDEVITESSWYAPLTPMPIVVGHNSHEAEAYPFPNTVHLWTLAEMSNYIMSVFGEESFEFSTIKEHYLDTKGGNTRPGNDSLTLAKAADKYSQIVTDVRVTCPLQAYAHNLRSSQSIQRYYIRSRHALFNPYGLDSFVSSAFHGWDAFLLFKLYRSHPDYIYAAKRDEYWNDSLEKLSENFGSSLKHFIWSGTLFPDKKDALLTIFENEIVVSTSIDDLSMCKKWNEFLSSSPYKYAWKA